MNTGQARDIEEMHSLLEGLDSQSEALRVCLQAGGLGAAVLAEGHYQSALALEGEVAWDQPLDEFGEGAVCDDNLLSLTLSNHSITVSREPRSLAISKREPDFEVLSVVWDKTGSITVESIVGDTEESWAIMADGSCVDGEELDDLVEERTDALEEREKPPYERKPATTPSEEGFGDWLQDLGFDDLAPLATAAAAAATAAAVGAAKRAVKKKVKETLEEPATPVQEHDSDMETCPDCGDSYPAGSAFCPHCGHKIEQKEVCAECGAELVEGAKFCAQCGTPVVREVVCQCGRTFGDNEKFCPSCGEKRP